MKTLYHKELIESKEHSDYETLVRQNPDLTITQLLDLHNKNQEIRWNRMLICGCVKETKRYLP
jgi:hypothetical protein